MQKISPRKISENQNTFSVNVETPQPVTPRKKSFLKKYFSLILIILVIVLAGAAVYFYKKSTTNPNEASQAEVKSLVEKVEKLVILPTDETPTIATVSDPDALKNQSFFIDAKKGDKVLIYSNAKKAVLYNPTSNKIVNIAPLNVDSTPKSPATTPTTTPASSDNKN